MPSIKRLILDSRIERLDAELLMSYVTGQPRSWLFAHADDLLDQTLAARFAELAGKRQTGEPVAYLTGTREFWSLPLTVDSTVLIPRPETERLVELALDYLPDNKAQPSVLDLGTGSGAVALAIASERPDATVVAVDQSTAALRLAQQNAEHLQLTNVIFRRSDWFDALQDLQFDLIAANPPYIRNNDPHLQRGDVAFEPIDALIAGTDGLDDIRRITTAAGKHLTTGGSLVVEHGFEQQPAVVQLFEQHQFVNVSAHTDLAGMPRCVSGRWQLDHDKSLARNSR